MKIVYFINQYPKVSHTFIRREILALERMGMDIRRIALRGWNESLRDEEDIGERAKTDYVLRRGIAGLMGSLLLAALTSPRRLAAALSLAARISRKTDRRLAYHLLRIAEACVVARWLWQFGASRMHAHFGTNSAEIALYASLLSGCPYSFTCHGPEEFESPLALDEKVRHASFVAAISSYGRSQLYLRCRPADWSKIKVVRCGVEASFHSGHPSEPNALRRLICVGRLCEAKGQLLLVEAVARLRDKGVDFELVLAGDGGLRPQIESAINRYGIADRVRITGWISSEEVRREILLSRTLVLPTFAEGLPVVIMEAMALRRPVLTTYVAGIPELVVDGVTGWLIPAGSLDDLIEAIEACLSASTEDLARMGSAGFERVVERHSSEREAAKLAEAMRAAS